MGRLADAAHRAALRIGLDVRRARADPVRSRRSRAIVEAGVDVAVDVGANAGQYGSLLREDGYDGRIVSFEPLPQARSRLAQLAALDPCWDVRPEALGAEAGRARLGVAGNSASSSLLEMGPRHRAAAPETAPVGEVEVEVRTLDGVLEELGGFKAGLLKLDVQGYELEVLRGARSCLDRFPVVEAELSLVELYEEQPLLHEVFGFLAERGYECVGLTPGFTDPATGEQLQADGLFLRG